MPIRSRAALNFSGGMMTHYIVRFLFAALVLFQSACSVMAAATGTPDPDLSKLDTGAPRILVESELGPPVEESKIPGGTKALYTYKIGDEPAIGRAFLFLIGDIFTLCLAEYIFFPLEISNSGNAHDMEVVYGADDKARSLRKVSSAPKK